MIGFFRRIRQTLIRDNQFIKYSKYVIGEILLVVIGILIALQVNNWNIQQKAAQEEITILKNIKEDINLDTLETTFNLSYHRKFYEAEGKLLNLLISVEEFEKDSINYPFALGAQLYTSLHKSTFSNLQNNEIGLLSNNELRKQISRFYDYYSQVITGTSNNFDDFFIYQKKLPYFKKHFKISKDTIILLKISADEVFDHNLGKLDIQLYDIESARNDEGFKFTLNESLFHRRALISFHVEFLNRISELTKAIDQELSILED